jgi:membrane protein
MRNNLRDARALARLIAKRFVVDRCAQTAAALTFTTLLSLVPIITIALTVVSVFPVFGNFSAQIRTYLLNNLMPENTADTLARYMQQFADNAARLTEVGIVFLALTALWMMLTIDNAFSVIWRISRPRPLVKRMVTYWAVLTLSPLLVGASLSLTSWLIGWSLGHGNETSSLGLMVLKILPILFTTLAFTLLFLLVPNRQAPRSHAMVGALVAAAMFETTNHLFGYYVSHFPTYKLVYGTFASVPIFLMWIYLSWFSILFGAVIAASLSHWRTPAEHDAAPATQLLDALRTLQILAAGHQKGTVYAIPELSTLMLLGYDNLDRILQDLASIDVVREVAGNGWVLTRDLRQVRVSELVRLFVLDPDALPSGKDDAPLRNWVKGFAAELQSNTDITLQELFLRQQAPMLAAQS